MSCSDCDAFLAWIDKPIVNTQDFDEIPRDRQTERNTDSVARSGICNGCGVILQAWSVSGEILYPPVCRSGAGFFAG
jgi:hypothetical protein